MDGGCVASRKCTHDDCNTQPSYGKAGGKAEYCRDHAKSGMVNVVRRKCTHGDCTKHLSYGKDGSKAEHCRDHAKRGVVDVISKRCAHGECNTIAHTVWKGAELGSSVHGMRRKVHPSNSLSQSSGDGEGRRMSGSGGLRSRGDGTGCRAGSGGRRTSRVFSVDPAHPISGRSNGNDKRTRPTVVSGHVRPVEVKREEPVDRVVDDEEPGASSESEVTAATNLVKTEDMEVSCKVKPMGVQEAGGNTLRAEYIPHRGCVPVSYSKREECCGPAWHIT